MNNEIPTHEFIDFKFEDFTTEIVDRKSLSENNIAKHLSNVVTIMETFKVNFPINKQNTVNIANYEINKIVKPVQMINFTFNVYDCSEKIDTPIPTPLPPIPSTPPVIVPQKTYLFSGINPINNQTEVWYDTNKNSKGPNGKIYIQVGILELDSSTL